MIDNAGAIVKENDRTRNDNLQRYQREMKADPEKLKQLVTTPDTFQVAIPVFTYDGSDIIEKQCEEPGWPNVTHDGLMMYENTFSTDRQKVIAWAKRNCLAWIETLRKHISEQEEQLNQLKGSLAKAEADARVLGIGE